MPETERLQQLFDRYLARECSPQEVEEFVVLLQDGGASGSLTPQMEALWNRIREEQRQYPVDWQRIYNTITYNRDPGRMPQSIDHEKITGTSKVKRMVSFSRVAAAAAIILMAGTGAYFLFTGQPQKKIAEGSTAQRFKNDVPPGGNRAVLTLSNGTKIILDSTRNGMLAQQGNTRILMLNNGALAYSAQPEAGGKPLATQYNILATPRGGQYQVRLPDGTRVWLNAASSIRYPTAFTGMKREVEVTGEAYFEVAQHAAMPFIVKKGDMEVQVLGTHFNVNAYDDEGAIAVTLLEGAVKVTQHSTQDAQLLQPGEQARVESAGRIKLIRNADEEQAVAWKNGSFSFQHNDIYEIMRQVSRWYDVDVSYKDSLDVHLSGQISKDVNASAVFRMLEFAGNVQFKIEGRKIIVTKQY